ncbi:MAG: NAD(P)-dependent dehydrogenase (short-subunit alcohol dehydrogenase family) [Gammaproteobacteria bacterium]
MNVQDKTVVVTGGASGIGEALATRFAREGARVVVADLDLAKAQHTAQQCAGLAVTCDVTKEADIQHLVDVSEQHFGPIDLFCSNAGICFGEPDLATSASNAQWQTSWELHVMAHVYAARAVLPAMIARGSGYFLQTASAAGLLSQIGDAAYSTTKHAALGFAESLAITHGDDGIKVSVICPQYVATPMLGYEQGDDFSQHDGLISPAQLADTVIEGLAQERFLILPHPLVQKYCTHKTADYDRWLSGMRRLRRDIVAQVGSTQLEHMHKLV